MKKIEICRCCEEEKPLFKNGVCLQCDEDINEVMQVLEKQKRFERAYRFLMGGENE